MVQLNFDATNVVPNAMPEPVPAAWYTCHITESKEKPTSNGTGVLLEFVMEIMDGPFAGRKIYDRLNVKNPNPVAVEIAYGTLSAICHATGVIQVSGSEQLHNIPLDVRVIVVPQDGQYSPKNEVKGYAAAGSAGQTQGGAVQTVAPQQPVQQPAQQQVQQPAQQQQQQPAQQQQQQQQQWQQPQQQNQQPAQQQPAQQQQVQQPVQQIQQQVQQPAQQQVQQPAQQQQQQQPVQTAPSADGQATVPPWAKK